uniref:Uncharacterized protein n=1 Tax=Arundo donax TaxID=35708 RepID=A0A0A9HQB1_ARUDO
MMLIGKVPSHTETETKAVIQHIMDYRTTMIPCPKTSPMPFLVKYASRCNLMEHHLCSKM